MVTVAVSLMDAGFDDPYQWLALIWEIWRVNGGLNFARFFSGSTADRFGGLHVAFSQ
jgi:hypothetical protein